LSESARIYKRMEKLERCIQHLPEKEKDRARKEIQKMLDTYLRERRGWG